MRVEMRHGIACEIAHDHLAAKARDELVGELSRLAGVAEEAGIQLQDGHGVSFVGETI